MMTTNKQMVDQPSSQIQGLQNLCLAKKSRRASCTYWHAHSLKSDLPNIQHDNSNPQPQQDSDLQIFKHE